MDIILNILKPGYEIFDNYEYNLFKIVSIARLTDIELDIINSCIFTETLKISEYNENCLFEYFQDGCIASQLRPIHYWKYVFKSL